MSGLIIKIGEDERIMVEEEVYGLKSVKYICMENFLECVRKSMPRIVTSGILPKGCFAFNQHDNGCQSVFLLYQNNRTDFSYYKTVYNNFPLPQLVFGFMVNPQNHICGTRLGIIDNGGLIKPDMRMYQYPFSNVSGFRLCTGNNVMPKCHSLHTLVSVPDYILFMPNNDDYFSSGYNRKNMSFRDLLEHLKDKTPEYYYSDILIPMGNKTLKDFIDWN